MLGGGKGQVWRKSHGMRASPGDGQHCAKWRQEALGWVEGSICMKQGIALPWKGPLQWGGGKFQCQSLEVQFRDKAGE